MVKGVITEPTENNMGLRVGLSKFAKGIVIQNYSSEDIDSPLADNVYVKFEEIDTLIKVLKEIKHG